MRTIDMHTHLPGKLFGPGHRPIRDILSMMDKAGVDEAVLLTTDGLFWDEVVGNNAVAEACASAQGRLIPFCTVEPRADNALAEIRRCVIDLGFRGIKLHPIMQGFSPLQDFMRPIAAEAVRLGVPILFHDGTPPYSAPLQVAYLCDQFPQLNVILGHGGGFDLWIEAVAAVQRYPNCFVCLSGSAASDIFERTIRMLDGQRVFIGTDAGFLDDDYLMQYRIDQFRRMDLPTDMREAIFWKNAVQLLDLPG